MVQQTDYHDWDLPEVNDDEDKWGDYIRNTFRAADEEAVKKDTYGNRPPAGTAGRWFLATDRMTLYYDDGNQWQTIVGQHMPDSDLRIERLVTDTGSASDPTHTFTGNEDTGLFTPTDDELGFTAGGQARAKFAADGSLRISKDGHLSHDTTTATVRISGDEGGVGLALQNVDDSLNNGAGKSTILWEANDGSHLAEMVAHPTDNHFSIYTGDAPVGNNPGLEKRFNIGAGSAEVAVDYQNVYRWILSNRSNDTPPHMILRSSQNTDGYILFQHSTDNTIYGQIRARPTDGEFGFLVGESQTETLRLDESGDVHVDAGSVYQSGTPVALTSRFPIPNADLQQDTVTVAGNAVTLGDSTAVSYGDLADASSFPIPNGDLANDTVTVAGNAVSLGNSTGISAHDLSDSGSVAMLDESESVTSAWTFNAGVTMGDTVQMQNHYVTWNAGLGDQSIYVWGEADDWYFSPQGTAPDLVASNANSRWEIGGNKVLDTSDEGSLDAGTLDGNDSSHYLDHQNATNVNSNDHHTRFGNASGDSIDDIPNRDHSQLTGVGSSDHHSKTQPSDIDSSNWDDYELQKDGADGTGVINFKTS